MFTERNPEYVANWRLRILNYQADQRRRDEQIRYAEKIHAEAEAVIKIASARLACLTADLAKHTDADTHDFAKIIAGTFADALGDTFGGAVVELEGRE